MINIRPARLEDAQALVELNHKIFVDNKNYDEDIKEDPAPKSYFEELINKDGGYFLILEDGGELMGYTNGGPVTYLPYRKSRYFEIENLGVIPERKGEGLGKTLLDEITAWAKKEGYQKIYLHCYSKNSEALGFYKKNGYSEIDVSLEKVI